MSGELVKAAPVPNRGGVLCTRGAVVSRIAPTGPMFSRITPTGLIKALRGVRDVHFGPRVTAPLRQFGNRNPSIV